MTIQRGTTRSLNDVRRRLLKAEGSFNEGKYLRAEKDIVRSITILSRILVSLDCNKPLYKPSRKITGRIKNE